MQLLVLVAAPEQTGLVSPGLGLRGADSVGQQLRPGRGVGTLTGHGPLPPPLPAGSRALHGKSASAPARPGKTPAPRCLGGAPPPPYAGPAPLPPPRARRSTRAGSSEAGRPVGWRARAADTGWRRPAPICSVPAACTGRVGSGCLHCTSGCRRSSSPRTTWGDRETHSEGQCRLSTADGRVCAGIDLHHFPPTVRRCTAIFSRRAVSLGPCPF